MKRKSKTSYAWMLIVKDIMKKENNNIADRTFIDGVNNKVYSEFARRIAEKISTTTSFVEELSDLFDYYYIETMKENF